MPTQTKYTDLASPRGSSAKNDPPESRSFWRRISVWREDFVPVLFWARLLVATAFVAEGYAMSVLSGAVMVLQDSLGLGHKGVQALVILSIAMQGIGAPIGSALSDWLGRRPSLMMAFCGMTVGSLTCALAPSTTILFVGRSCETGSMGAVISIVTTYITEVAPSHQRGEITSLAGVFFIVGVCAGYGANWAFLKHFHSWRIMFGLGSVLSFTGFLLLLLGITPESPRFLMAQGRARRSPSLSDVLYRLFGSEEAGTLLREQDQLPTLKYATWGEAVCPRRGPRRRSFIVAIGVMLLQKMSGISIANVYLAKLFAEEIGVEHALQAVMCIGVARLIATLASHFIIEEVGRRCLLSISSTGVTVMLALTGATYYFGCAVWPWKLSCLAAYTMFFELGLGTVPYVYVAEILENSVRSKGVALALLISRIYCSSQAVLFMITVNVYGPRQCFCILAVVNCAGAIFVFCYVPETAGMALEDMHRVFTDAPPSTGASLSGAKPNAV